MTKDAVDPDLEDPEEGRFLLTRGWRRLRRWMSRLDLGNQIIIYRVGEDEAKERVPPSKSEECLYRDATTPPPP
jgi:hypothetical protein